ncbi:hypothetical protein TNCV_118981 [Trichonephila clavipes]|nr:hypothetical protein TNCV_118981 [Trichonephila clavipes]
MGACYTLGVEKNRYVPPRDPLTGLSPIEDVKAAHRKNHTPALSTGIKANPPCLRDGCSSQRVKNDRAATRRYNLKGLISKLCSLENYLTCNLGNLPLDCTEKGDSVNILTLTRHLRFGLTHLDELEAESCLSGLVVSDADCYSELLGIGSRRRVIPAKLGFAPQAYIHTWSQSCSLNLPQCEGSVGERYATVQYT